MTTPLRRLLVAEGAASELIEGEQSLFSTESEASPASFTQDELFALSPRFAALYARLIERLAPLLEAEGLPPAAADAVLKDAVPPVTHLVLDRALRLERLLASGAAEGLSVRAPGGPLPSFGRGAALREAAVNSREFNEAVLGALAPVFGLPVAGGRPRPESPVTGVETGYVNFNFEGRDLWSRAKGRLYRAAAKLRPGRVPALSLAYATLPLQDAGLYGPGRLEPVRGRGSFPEARPEPGLRAGLAKALVAASGDIEAFLAASGVAPGRTAALGRACARLIAALFPADSLEGAAAHLASAQAVLAPFDARALFLTETLHTESTFLLAAARVRGMETIGVQDGGHYGYIEDYVSAEVNEFPQFDRYVSWGWTRFPEGARAPVAVPLPSPWLSVRRAQWARDMGPGPSWWGAERPHDLLLMTNKLYAFPPAPSGAAVARSDHAPAFAAGLKTLVAQAAAQGVSVLHKSYNVAAMRSLTRTQAEMSRLGGGRYAHVERIDKGLSPELLRRVRLVLWEQPGTGLFECLHAGIPTMVLWSRLYSRELPWARPVFAELEAAGLVHRDPTSLLAEYARFKADPVAWMREPRRVKAAEALCASYGRADDDWAFAWAKLIDEAGAGRL